MAARPGTCDRLRTKAHAGDRRALATAKRLDCDWAAGDLAQSLAELLAQPRHGACREIPVTFTTADGRTVGFTRRVGPGCGPRASSPTPAQLASRERFREAMQQVKTGACGPAGDPDPMCPVGERTRTEVLTPSGADRAHYALFEASDVIPSHNPMTFSPDPRYPGAVQEREYQHDENEQFKVKSQAQHLRPSLIIHRSPTAVDGPPIVTEDGCALGGNGRTMAIKRAYAEHPDRAAAYREALACGAPDFGLPGQAVRGMAEPVLVRVVDGARCDDDPTDLAKAVRRYNEGLTNAIDTKALGVSLSRQMRPETLHLFGQLVSGDRTLREVLRDDPRQIIQALENDRILTKENRTKYVLPSGHLTDEAKGQIEAMFVGRVLGTSERVRGTDPAVIAKLEKAVPYITAVAGRNPAFDLTRSTQEAVDLLNRASSSGKSLEFTIQQRGFFDKPPSREALEIARMLSGLGPNTVRDRFKAWAQKADFDPGQATLGERPATFEDAFLALTTAPRTGRAIFRGSVVNQERTPGRAPILARIVEVGSKSGDLADGRARIEYMSGPRRGEREVANVAELGDVVG